MRMTKTRDTLRPNDKAAEAGEGRMGVDQEQDANRMIYNNKCTLFLFYSMSLFLYSAPRAERIGWLWPAGIVSLQPNSSDRRHSAIPLSFFLSFTMATLEGYCITLQLQPCEHLILYIDSAVELFCKL